mmetsp:Transcript_53077/g.141909  ORF Transcript_53077/g.141909 Transcript_53077/m.141909 type:complete len:290 (-) Transcript_53077:160-1029(-)
MILSTRFEVLQEELMKRHSSDGHMQVWIHQEDDAWSKCQEAVKDPHRSSAIVFMRRAEELFDNVSFWVEALQLVDISSGGTVDDDLLVRALVAFLVIIKFRSVRPAEEAVLPELVALANEMSTRAITVEHVAGKEMSLLAELGYDVDIPTPLAWFGMFLVRFDILTDKVFNVDRESVRAQGALCIEKCVSAASCSSTFAPKKMAASLLGLFLNGWSLLSPDVLQPVEAGWQWTRAVEGARQRIQTFDEAGDFLSEFIHATQLEEHELRQSVSVFMERFGDEVLAAFATS